MSYKNNDECLKKAAPDEPIFILRAQDKLAPAIVRAWAALAEAGGTPRDKVEEARQCARNMEHWQVNNTSKFPD